MTDPNSAFLWETEAMRASPQRVAEVDEDSDSDEKPDGNWVTLREASRATDIPVETLRKWARRATVPTYLTAAPGGTNIRMVDLEGVARRAAELGREIHPTSEPVPIVEEQSAVRQASAIPTEPAAPVAETPPAGTMIVPIDAWNKMLNQLGNLHEAGQQLAEARERAAKAETEAIFLRERLSDLRLGSVESVPTPDSVLEQAPSPAQQVAAPPEKVWRYLIRRVRDRR